MKELRKNIIKIIETILKTSLPYWFYLMRLSNKENMESFNDRKHSAVDQIQNYLLSW